MDYFFKSRHNSDHYFEVVTTFHCGVDSPVRIASLVIAVPANKSISAGTVLSSPF